MTPAEMTPPLFNMEVLLKMCSTTHEHVNRDLFIHENGAFDMGATPPKWLLLPCNDEDNEKDRYHEGTVRHTQRNDNNDKEFYTGDRSPSTCGRRVLDVGSAATEEHMITELMKKGDGASCEEEDIDSMVDWIIV